MSDPSTDDFSPALPEEIPRPTAWPAAAAFGVTFLLWGVITSPVLLGIGLALFTASVIGWIGEIRHEERRS